MWPSCMQVQHAVLLSALMLDLAVPDVVGLWKAAADHKRHVALFGPCMHSPW